MVDLLALVLVVASGPAAYAWLDQTHPGPIAAQSPTATPTPATSPSAPPGTSGSPSASQSVAMVHGNGTWAGTGSLPQPVWAGASVLLHDGRVMVVGGSSSKASEHAVATASIFDPATGQWSAVTPMLQPRTKPEAVTLADGSVLVAGGMRNGQPLDTAERYFPATGTWVAAGRLNLPRTEGSLTLLQDGRVLASGGGIEGAPGWAATASAEIFDPAIGEWTITAAMSVARANATATLLPDGEVLVAGGENTFEASSGSVTATAEIFSPRLNGWRPAGSMTKPRYSAGAVLLPDGRVLVAGGWYSEKVSDKSHNTTEIFDPATGHWTAATPMTSPRAQHALLDLPDGRVLAVGGVDTSNKIFIGTEMYDPVTGTWRQAQPLGLAVILPAVQVLLDGRVLVAGGGLNVTGTRLTAACQLYSPAAR